MSKPMEPHPFDEDVADASMCMCGVPAISHHLVEPERDEQDWSPIRVQTFETLSDVRRHVEGLR